MEFHVNLIGRKNLSDEIYRQIRQAIADGRLRHGDCLPASRDMARSLDVSRTTVTVAYDRLAGEGFVITRIGAGTYVSKGIAPGSKERRRARAEGAIQPQAVWNSIRLSDAFARPAQFDFRTGLPDASLFPHREWRRVVARELRSDAVSAGAYGDPAGHPDLREAIARHIGVSRGVRASADNITITAGGQQAIDIIARTVLEPGACVAVEDPGYLPPRFLFKSLGARTIATPVDDEGIVVSALPRQARLVYVTPSHQYPLGVTMSLPRRLALLDWAARNDAAILEDDYDSEFRFSGRPIEPLQTLDKSGRVIYVGSFSKTLSPTLRLGFVVTPSCCTPAARKAKYVTDWHSSTLIQGALARLIDGGGFARHIRKVNRIYAERRELIMNILTHEFSDHLTTLPSVAGLHVAALARSASVSKISAVVARASDLGVEVQELSNFTVDAAPRAGLVIGYGAIPTASIQVGLRRLWDCFNNLRQYEYGV
jgi:GntR family transcriptional regulator / MocR family aminotransferase